jgi:membrane protein DedA with SNARE-associated domain
MTDLIIEYIELGAANAYIWGYILIFALMTIESSFIPFPSEVIMIPAGFLAYRGELFFRMPCMDMTAALLCGLAGSLAGAFINYYLALCLGRPFLYRYGKYFFIRPKLLSRAEGIFLEHGEITTFTCRLLPGIRQLISLPAGLSHMPLIRFALFTSLGAGIWSFILLWIGYYLGSLSGDTTYAELVRNGKGILAQNYIWVLVSLAVIIVFYALCYHFLRRLSPKP